MSETNNTEITVQPSNENLNNRVISESMDFIQVSGANQNVKELKDKLLSGPSVCEGKAIVCFPGADDTVFYNPVQEFNRDLR